MDGSVGWALCGEAVNFAVGCGEVALALSGGGGGARARRLTPQDPRSQDRHHGRRLNVDVISNSGYAKARLEVHIPRDMSIKVTCRFAGCLATWQAGPVSCTW